MNALNILTIALQVASPQSASSVSKISEFNDLLNALMENKIEVIEKPIAKFANLRGSYNPSDRKITLFMNAFQESNDSFQLKLETLRHESLHAAQHCFSGQHGNLDPLPETPLQKKNAHERESFSISKRQQMLEDQAYLAESMEGISLVALKKYCNVNN